MASTTIPGTTPITQQQATDYPAGSLRFDWAVILASLWFLAGQFLDGWAHNNLASSLETFFTPWHAVLYTGYFAVAGVLLFTQVRNMQRGYPWTHAVPNGYWLSLLGVALFSVGGVAISSPIWRRCVSSASIVVTSWSSSHDGEPSITSSHRSSSNRRTTDAEPVSSATRTWALR